MTELPRPSLLRSLTFWSGLLLVVFTLWAWRDSVHNWTGWGDGSTYVASRSCGLQIYHRPGPALSHLSCTRETVSSVSFGGRFPELDSWRFGRPDFGGYLELDTRRELNRTGMLEGRSPDPVVGYFYDIPEDITPGEWLLFIPYWCVVLAVAAVWLGLIYWRYRRIREAPAELTEPG